jgi:Domain of unknown function (DUF4279)
MPKHIGHFELTGDFDPDEITRLLDIDPSWIHRKGGLWYEESHGPSKVSGWVLYCLPDCGGEVDSQIVTLLSTLWPKRDIVKKLCSDYFGCFNLYAYLDGNSMGFSLDQGQLLQLHSLGISLQCEYIHARDGYFDDYFHEGREPLPPNDNQELIAGHYARLEQLNKTKAE